MSDTAHQEKHFENYIVAKLAEQGWLVGDTSKYDTERALYLDEVEYGPHIPTLVEIAESGGLD